MPAYSGTVLRTFGEGDSAAACPCRLEFNDESLTLIPAAGPPLSLDLGDIDEFSPADIELHLTLYTGEKFTLARFGKSFQDLLRELQEAYRERLVRCLLLEDLEEIARFEGTARLDSAAGGFSAPAEIRLYQSNLAVLPQSHTGFQWRLADIETMSFDDSSYAIVLRSSDEVLSLTRLAKRTRELYDRLQAAMADVTGRSALTVRSVFPFLTPEQFQSVAELMKDGHVAAAAKLASIHPGTGRALTEKIVSARLKPYYEFLTSRAASCGPYAGFKLIRKDAGLDSAEEEEIVGEAEGSGPASEAVLPDGVVIPPGEEDSGESEAEVLHWFIFPLRTPGAAEMPQIAAWEATSHSGRATYFFRLIPPGEVQASADPARHAAAIDEAIGRLNRSLLMLNFRREPIYLSDDALQMQPRYRRYTIACRKIPSLRQLRSSFLGRVIHTAPQAWQQQVEHLLAAMNHATEAS
jgi:hypothetical protein